MARSHGSPGRRAEPPGPRRRAAARGLLAALLPITAGCAAAADPRPSPETLVFSPARTEAVLTIDNPGDAPRSLARIRLDPQTPDWGSFLIVDRTIPTEVPARGRAELHLVADLEHFVTEHAPGQPVRYRPGRARVLLELDDRPLAVPLRFEAPPAVDVAAVAAGAGLFALLAGLVLAAVRRRAALTAIPWLFLVTLAMTPWGLGLCTGAIGSPLGLADLEQCGAGHGGVALAWLHPDAGLLLWIAALLVVDLVDWAASMRGSAPTAALRQASRRLALDLALVLAALSVSLTVATVDLAAIAGAQGDAWWGPIPGWSVVRLPVAAAIFVLAQSLRRATLGAGAREALDRVAFALLGTALFLGGGTLPGGDPLLARLPHLVAVLVSASAVLLKTAALFGLLRALDRWRSGAGARRWLGPGAVDALVLASLLHLVIVALTRAPST
ncbi:MAG: hypothetical protein R3B09_22915 [Nannocystaceae bacterium]